MKEEIVYDGEKIAFCLFLTVYNYN